QGKWGWCGRATDDRGVGGGRFPNHFHAKNRTSFPIGHSRGATSRGSATPPRDLVALGRTVHFFPNCVLACQVRLRIFCGVVVMQKGGSTFAHSGLTWFRLAFSNPPERAIRFHSPAACFL